MVPQTRARSVPLRVLVVEDEVLTRIALCDDLRAAGVAVIEAVNADEAWAYLQAGGAADLVFSDIHLPGSMNGLELARRVRHQYPDVEVILTSGNLKPVTAEWLGQFLPKPYALENAVKFILDTLARNNRNVQ